MILNCSSVLCLEAIQNKTNNLIILCSNKSVSFTLLIAEDATKKAGNLKPITEETFNDHSWLPLEKQKKKNVGHACVLHQSKTKFILGAELSDDMLRFSVEGSLADQNKSPTSDVSSDVLQRHRLPEDGSYFCDLNVSPQQAVKLHPLLSLKQTCKPALYRCSFQISLNSTDSCLNQPPQYILSCCSFRPPQQQ